MLAQETSKVGVRPGGVYRHKETGEEVIAVQTEKFGNPQADAFVRLGFEYVGPVKRKADVQAVENMPDPHAAPVATPQGVKSSAELRAELAEAEAREEAFRKERVARGLEEPSEEDIKAEKEAAKAAKEAAKAEKAEKEAAKADEADSEKEGK